MNSIYVYIYIFIHTYREGEVQVACEERSRNWEALAFQTRRRYRRIASVPVHTDSGWAQGSGFRVQASGFRVQGTFGSPPSLPMRGQLMFRLRALSGPFSVHQKPFEDFVREAPRSGPLFVSLNTC